jgi:hypothetical protein
MAAARRGPAGKPAEPATGEVEPDAAPAEPETAPAVEPETADEAPAVLAGAGLGGIAFEAYRDAVGGQAVNGDELPTWDDLVGANRDVAAAWCAAAQAVLTATFERKQA